MGLCWLPVEQEDNMNQESYYSFVKGGQGVDASHLMSGGTN